MSEQDILADYRMAKRLQAAKYQVWKRNNIAELHEAYEDRNPRYKGSFEKFCREIFDETS